MICAKFFAIKKQSAQYINPGINQFPEIAMFALNKFINLFFFRKI